MDSGFVASGLGTKPSGLVRRCSRPANVRCSVAQPERNVTRFNTEGEITSTVEKLYDVYPFPPDPLIDEEPIGYNWRWHYPTAYSFCAKRAPETEDIRILDAGCGTGCGTEYLVHLNKRAEVVGIDLSGGALGVATERLSRSVGKDNAARATLIQKSIFDAGELEGDFDMINCVGVIHHTPDPLRAILALKDKLKPGGILHIFVYALNGRWEIQLMQKALALLQQGEVDFKGGVELGRKVFAALPEENRLRKREESRWAAENERDATFADMYLHPQEIDYTIDTLFEMIDAAELEFIGFSNPRNFDLARVLKDEELLNLAKSLPERDQYRLVQNLDPESVTHFEFFLSKEPFETLDWSDTKMLHKAMATISPCIHGFPNKTIFDGDYFPIVLSDTQFEFLKSLSDCASIGSAAKESGCGVEEILALIDQTIIIPNPQ